MTGSAKLDNVLCNLDDQSQRLRLGKFDPKHTNSISNRLTLDLKSDHQDDPCLPTSTFWLQYPVSAAGVSDGHRSSLWSDISPCW